MLALMYPDQGVFVKYETIRESEGSYYVGCPSKSDITLVVWDPSQELPLGNLSSKVGQFSFYSSKDLEEATSFAKDEFFETFKDPNNTSCLETPVDLWPEP